MRRNAIVGVVSSLVVGMVVSAMVAGCRCPWARHGSSAGGMGKAMMTQSVYVCPDCDAMALKAGPCATCKKDMKPMHLLGTKDGQALVCSCEAGCKCDVKGIKDDKCACGMAIAKVSAKGLYACPMGCPVMSDKPGKCACGMDMKKCE